MAQYSAVGNNGNSGGDTNSVDVPVAGTPAAGNILAMLVVNQRNENTWATPSGWTIIGSQRNGAAAFYKVAAGGETTVTVTKTGTTGRCIGTMLLITPSNAGGAIAFDVSNSAAATTVSTMTPTKEATLWVWLAGESSDAADFSGYAMATSDPTPWTERFENDAAGQCSGAGATSSLRTATTGTGNCTVTNSLSVQPSGFVFAVTEVASASPAADVQALTVTQPSSSITTTSNVPVTELSITAAIATPTVTTEEYPIFSNTSKNAASATDATKNAATASNTAKNAASASNTQKT